MLSYKQMIIRGLRSQNNIKGDFHRQLQNAVSELRIQNKELRLDVLRLEQKLLESQQSKQKYKHKYREAKQKLEILGLIGMHSQKQPDIYDCCSSPRTKATRIKTASQEEFHSFKGLFHSELDENFSTKPYIAEPDEYQMNLCSRKNLTPVTTLREHEPEKEDPKILQNLLKVHEQLDKLSNQIQSLNAGPAILNLESGVYKKFDQVLEKLNQMESRDLQRQKQRMQRERDRTTKRYNSSMKAVQQIGRNLVQFKVDD